MKHLTMVAPLLFPALLWGGSGITFSDPYIRLVPPGIKNTAGYLIVKNSGPSPRKIVRAMSASSEAVELHTHLNDAGIMRMRPVTDVSVPSGGEAAFAPGGLHLMLLGLRQPLNEGGTVRIVLEFDGGEKISVDFIVRSINGEGGRHDHHAQGPHIAHTGHQGHNAPDMAPPAGVMGAHMHHAGAWIIDYRSMLMGMNHINEGSKHVDAYNVLFGIYNNPKVQMPMTGLAPPSPFLPGARIETNEFRYMSTGTRMSMEMGMLSVMHQPGENTMLMLMVPYVQNKMDMLANNFQTSKMAARGVGDASASLLVRIKQGEMHALFAGVGLSMPTGSIDEKDNMPQMGKSQLSYSMQPGAGTYALVPEMDYTGRSGRAGWGISAKAMLFAAKNDNNYRPGHRYAITAWTSWRLLEWISGSARLQQSAWGNYLGQDASLDPSMDPGNDPLRQGGRRTDIFAGVNMSFSDGPFGGLRLLLEFGRPIKQHLNGPQMAEAWAANLGFQYAL